MLLATTIAAYVQSRRLVFVPMIFLIGNGFGVLCPYFCINTCVTLSK